MQQFCAGFDKEFAAAAMRAAGYSMQFVLPNRTPLPATREAGLVQIANELTDRGLVMEVGKATGIWPPIVGDDRRCLWRLLGLILAPSPVLMNAVACWQVMRRTQTSQPLTCTPSQCKTAARSIEWTGRSNSNLGSRVAHQGASAADNSLRASTTRCNSSTILLVPVDL